MDDLDAHVKHMNIILDKAVKGGFEFELVKGQLNQSDIVLWGCICDSRG